MLAVAPLFRPTFSLGVALMFRQTKLFCFVLTLTCTLVTTAKLSATQFSFLDPAYTQQIYAGPNVGLPGAWTTSNQMLARKANVPDILEYNVTPNTVYQGT